MNKLRLILLVIPVTFFLLLFMVFYLSLRVKNPDQLPSVLINKSAPQLQLKNLGQKKLPIYEDLTESGIKLVNFWASWCGPCRVEHENLKKIVSLGYPIFGVNYKDNEKNALKFLDELGDPYTKVGADPSGRIGLDWGLYGVPETFILDDKGNIILRYPGPITSAILKDKILPVLQGVR